MIVLFILPVSRQLTIIHVTNLIRSTPPEGKRYDTQRVFYFTYLLDSFYFVYFSQVLLIIFLSEAPFSYFSYQHLFLNITRPPVSLFHLASF